MIDSAETSLWIAWAAGLFEGEGSISVRNGKPIMQLKMCDGEVVERFQAVVRLGKVYGPYENRVNDGYPRSPYFVWTASSDDSAIVIEMFWPWLSDYRRTRAAEVGFGVLA